jgi:uncharacterized membrane protein
MVQATARDEGRGAPARGLLGLVESLEQRRSLDRLAERMRPVAGSLREGRRGEVLRGEPIGHAMHPMLTDLPLGCFLSAHLLDLFGGRRGRRSAQRLIGMGLVAVPPTVAAGMADWGGITDPRARRVGVVHAAANAVAALFYLRSWRWRRKGRHLRGMTWGFAGGGAALLGGYLGGHLSFGKGIGVGPRGSEAERHAENGGDAGRAPATQGVVDLDEASMILGVPTEQVQAMAEQGLLAPVQGDGPSARFLVSEVEAVRLTGG